MITAIIPSARRPGRFEVIAGEETVATLSLDAIERLGLAVGKPLEPIRSALEFENGVTGAHDRALRVLSVRARSTAELRRLLVRKGELPEHVDVAIPRLEAAGFLDDASFARQFARTKIMSAGHSRARLQSDLGRLGVARSTATEAIDSVFQEEGVDEGALVLEAARRRARSLSSLAPEVRARRLGAWLARRGYGYDAIRAALDAVAGEHDG